MQSAPKPADPIQKSTQPHKDILGRLGPLVVRIALNADEIAQALAVRRKVFSHVQSDSDEYDSCCDHLIVEDNETEPGYDTGSVVATYRLLRQEKTPSPNGFYSASQFDLKPLLERQENLRFLEFGRSCVLPDYRSKRTLELLWHGSWAYVRQNSIDVMFGCASFPGTEPQQHAEELAFLYHQALAKDDWHVAACSKHRVAMNMMEKNNIDLRRAMRAMPPLVKGYLRLGAKFAGEAVVDPVFGTIDVLVLLPVASLNPKYVNYYGENAERHAAH